MKIIFLVLASINVVLSYGLPPIGDRRMLQIDSLIEELKQDVWDAEEITCLETTLSLLSNLKNFTLWATWVWTANQHPTGVLYGSSHQLGSYDQCMNPPWLTTHPQLRTQYCTAEVKMVGDRPQKGRNVFDPYDSTEEYINSTTKYGIQFNTLYWGVCVPASCRPRSVSKLIKLMYLGSQYAPAEPNITVDYCQVAGEDYQYTLGFYLFMYMIAALFITTLVSTYRQSRVTSTQEHQGSFVSLVTKCFCLKRNYNNLVKANPDEIHSMHGIRFLSGIMLVFLHTILYLMRMPMINFLDVDKDFESGIAGQLLNGSIIVDTFFMLSGVLHIRGLMTSGRRRHLIFVLLKRYFRLLGPLAVSIFYTMSVAEHISTGPMWQKYCEDERQVCSENWIHTFLMIKTDMKDACHLVTWYIPCDYQLTILGTVLFYLYLKNKNVGYAAFSVTSVLALIIPGFLTYWHRLPVLHYDKIPDFMDPRNVLGLEYNYSRSYLRAGAYLIGIAMGYLMSVYKPKDYRKAIPKKWSIIGTSISTMVIFLIAGLSKIFHDVEYNAIDVAVTVTLHRAIWAFAVCCIIVFCEYGSVPILNAFFSLPAFIPLSRLCYGMYLIHPFIIQRSLYAARIPLKFELFTFIIDTLGTVVTACLFSFVLWLLVESPFINVTNLLFKESKLDKPITDVNENKTCEKNGTNKDKKVL